MKLKALNIPLIILGAVLLIFSSALAKEIQSDEVIWFKITGLILLMVGIYRISRFTPEKTEDEHQER